MNLQIFASLSAAQGLSLPSQWSAEQKKDFSIPKDSDGEFQQCEVCPATATLHPLLTNKNKGHSANFTFAISCQLTSTWSYRS